jgi:glycosyltransferase involved in cell wall biosynthesis
MAAKLCFLALLNSSRKGGDRPSVLLDMRPLQGPSASRGVGAYARGLLKGLIKVGYDARLTLLLDVAFDAPEMPVGQYRLAECRRRSHGQVAAYEDAVALANDIARIAPDVYHAIDFHLPGRSPRPLVVTLHDLIPWVWGGRRMLGERLRNGLFRRLLPRADAVLAVSESTAADAVRLHAVARSRIRVAHEAPDPVFAPRHDAAARVRAKWAVDGRYLLFVGALDARKDPHALLRAWTTARLAHPDLKLLIAGVPGRQAPPSMAGAIQLGRVDDDELADLYSAASCLVFPSRYEGFGLPCLEAMACGCPVAAFRNSSIPEVVDGAAMLVEDGDAEALGTAVGEIVTAPEPWKRAGIEHARHFSWEKAARETVAAYRTVVDALR